MKRPLVSIDLETTGVDPLVDRIVEIALIRSDGEYELQKCWLVNPGVPIPAEATMIHAITDHDVCCCPPFKAIADEVLAVLDGADIVGYNLRRLDLPMLDEELRRCGCKLYLAGVQVIDCYGIFAKQHPRRLEDAVRLYCGRDHTDAHGALADAQATLDVLNGQIGADPALAKMTAAELAAYSRPEGLDYADLAGKLYRDKDGDLRFAFGKAKDVKVRNDLGYADWMMHKASFPGNTIDVLIEELDRLAEESRPRTLFDNKEIPF